MEIYDGVADGSDRLWPPQLVSILREWYGHKETDTCIKGEVESYADLQYDRSDAVMYHNSYIFDRFYDSTPIYFDGNVH